MIKSKKYDIGVTVLKNRIYLNRNKKKWCIVQLYNFKYDMQQDYVKYCKERGQEYNPVKGASTHYWKSKGKLLSGETGTVFLSVEDSGAGVVTHELMHATLFANQHNETKTHYPIVIKNMRQEETILHNHTYAVIQFYNWFYRVAKAIS